ncbi:hypothetical protein FH603_254 [Spirosoma sp. LMG 31447]|uniref:Serine aminopeptidase S33 domain-containing protein n=2 Tax=Spirosoma utsteinense TaxID=2585773 RepID=A0ABR6VZK5_9BACT|nr:hypothetical protein [Spirosoma utsteinense]
MLTFLVSLISVAGLAQTQEMVQLKTADLNLNGTLTLPDGATGRVPVLLLIAGSGATDRDGNNPIPAGQMGSVKANSYKLLADSLSKAGVAVLRYDKRGVGTSKLLNMNEASLTFDTYIEDAVGWIKQLRNDKRFSNVGIVGHSEGSLIGMVAARQAKADVFVSLAGPGDDICEKLKTQVGKQLPDESKQEVFRALDSLKGGHTLRKLPTPYAPVRQLFRPSVQPYLISWMKYNPAAQLKLLTIPVLIIQGMRDVQVSVKDAELLKAARPSARIKLFEAMSHGLKDVRTDSMQEAITSYNEPGGPLTAGLAAEIAHFIKG